MADFVTASVFYNVEYSSADSWETVALKANTPAQF